MIFGRKKDNWWGRNSRQRVRKIKEPWTVMLSHTDERRRKTGGKKTCQTRGYRIPGKSMGTTSSRWGRKTGEGEKEECGQEKPKGIESVCESGKGGGETRGGEGQETNRARNVAKGLRV